jgi:hypothetical protein
MTSDKQLAIQLMPSAGLILHNYLKLTRRLRAHYPIKKTEASANH